MAHILVIEDDPVQLRCVSEGLRHAGFEVATAMDARAALELAQEIDFDLALVDYQLEETTGLQILDRIFQFRYLPFIMMTSCQDEQLILTAASKGALAFITKPIALSALIPQIYIALIRGQQHYHLELDIENVTLIATAVGILAARLNTTVDKARSTLHRLTRRERDALLLLATKIVSDQNSIVLEDTITQLFYRAESG